MDCEFVDISKHFSKILRHGGCHEADGVVRWTHVWTRMKDAEETQNCNKEDWIDAHSRSTDKPRIEYCANQKHQRLCIRVVQGHSHDVAVNPNLFSCEKDTVELEGTHIPHGQLLQLQSILENGLWTGGLSLRSTRQACFFSESARIVIETVNDRPDRTR